MGKSGFKIIEIISGVVNPTTDMMIDFKLPDDWPPDLMTFLHISLSLSESSTVSVIRDGNSYPINNNEPLIGEVYRSITIEKDEIMNFQVGTGQTAMRAKFALEE